MDETILLGRGADLIPLDRRVWEGHLAQVPEHGRHRLDFMTPDHHRVRYFVVREMPGLGRPIEPVLIAGALELPLSQVIPILEDLERHLLFLVRNEQGAVAWAYPVTCEQTAHQVRFSSGERIYAAWAEDAIAVPFVQGHLRDEPLLFEIETVCGHCGRAMQFEFDTDLNYRVKTPGAQPMVFEPKVDWATFTEPNIIHAY